MNENGKTLTYVGIALALGVVAVLARPKQEPPPVATILGKPLFDKFTDPNKAASLKIVRYAEDVGEVTTFEVAKNSNGMWAIPTHGNYPADAETQMKDAATSLVGLTVLDIASEDQADHEMYGVREPTEKLQIGDKGVGLLVSFDDDTGTSLGSLIVGKEVKNRPEQRFVRVPRQDSVFVVKISPEKLSTKFEDWIEKDLLKINNFDIDRLRLKDHSVIQTTQGPVAQPRSEITISLDANGSQWKLDEMLIYGENGPQKSDLLPGEELNKEKLDALKNALSEVKIADVFQKPKGLDAALKMSGDFLKDREGEDARETQRSLAQRGFYLSSNNEIWSANGELQVRQKDGVEYVLRFGNISGEQQDSKDGKLNRYLFVMARVDESKFPPPTLEDLPSDTGASPAPAASSTPAANPAEKSNEKGAEKAADPKATDTKAEDKSAEKSPGSGDCSPGQEKAADERETEKPATEKPATEKPATEKAATEKAATEKKGSAAAEKKDAAPADQKKDAAASPPATAEKKAEAPVGEEEIKKKKLEAERERINKENTRKLEKWKEDKGKAEEKVRELNGRFARWYYVVSEDVYKKIHLNRSDVIKEGAKSAAEGTGVDAFRKLEQGGLKKPAAGGPGAAGAADSFPPFVPPTR